MTLASSGIMSLRLHPDKCDEQVADFCGGREKVDVIGTRFRVQGVGFRV